MTDSKPKRRSEEIAVEIREQNIEYGKLLKECQKLAELKAKQYDKELESLNTSKGKTYQEIILKLGRYLARYQLKDAPYKISAKLKRDLKGFIHRSQVYAYALDEWRDHRYNQNPTGKNRSLSSKTRSNERSISTTELTPQDERYLQAHEHETIRNELIDKFFTEWTGINKNQIPEIAYRTEKGKHWVQTILADKTDFIKDIGYKMTMSALHSTLGDMRALEILRNGVSDILYEVYEQRKKTETLDSV